MPPQSSIAVLIPCYNEAQTVGKVINDFYKAFSNQDIKVYVYDNCSTDETSSISLAHKAIVRKSPYKGKGNTVRLMFREIEANYYILVDGDDTYPAEASKEMLEVAVQNNADMVVGDRLSNGTYLKENKRRFHNFGNNLVRFTIKLFYSYDYKDVMTGYRVFSKRFVKTFPVLSDGFQIETEMSIHSADKKLRIENVPVSYRDRPVGSVSKLNTLKDGVSVITSIVMLFKEYKPLKLFGVVGLLLLFVSFVIFLPIYISYISTGVVLQQPTLIVDVGFAVTGILFILIGLVLDNISRANRRQWEISYLTFK